MISIIIITIIITIIVITTIIIIIITIIIVVFISSCSTTVTKRKMILSMRISTNLGLKCPCVTLGDVRSPKTHLFQEKSQKNEQMTSSQKNKK